MPHFPVAQSLLEQLVNRNKVPIGLKKISVCFKYFLSSLSFSSQATKIPTMTARAKVLDR